MKETVKVFICYRRSDGSAYASELFELLHNKIVEFDDGVRRRISVYFDQNAPGVSDWKSHHFPELEAAKALIVICTHGLRADLSDSKSKDFAYEELRYWCNDRDASPIVIDAVANSNGRWVPTVITDKWPDINRLDLPQDENDRKFLNRIVGTIQESENVTNRQNVTKFERLNHDLTKYSNRLVLMIAVSLTLAVIAAYSGFNAKQQAERAESSTNSIVELFLAADPDRIFTGTTAAEQLLEISEAIIIDRTDDPRSKFRMLTAMGAAHTGLENHEKALSLLIRAEKLSTDRIPPEERFKLDVAIGEAYLYLSDYELARDRIMRARAMLDRGLVVPGSQKSSFLITLGDWHAWADTGSEELAKRYYLEAIEIDETLDSALVARDHNRLASLSYFNRDFVGVRHHSELAAAYAEKGTSPIALAESKYNLGAITYEEGDLTASLQYYDEALVAFKRFFGHEHPQVSDTEASIGRILLEFGQSQNALELLRLATQNMEKELGSDHWSLAVPLNNLALALRSMNDRSAASYFRRSAAISKTNKSAAGGHSYVHLSEISMDADDLVAADRYQMEASAIFSSAGINSGWEYALLQGAQAEKSLRELQKKTSSIACDGDSAIILDQARADIEVSSAILRSKWVTENFYTSRQGARERMLEIQTRRCE